MSEEISPVAAVFDTMATLVYTDSKEEAAEKVELAIPEQFMEGAKLDLLVDAVMDATKEAIPAHNVIGSAIVEEEEEDEEEGDSLVSVSLITSVKKATEALPVYKKQMEFAVEAINKLNKEELKPLAAALKEALTSDKADSAEYLTNFTALFINPLHMIFNSIEGCLGVAGLVASDEEEESGELAPLSPKFTISFPVEHEGLTDTCLVIEENDEVINFFQSFSAVCPFFSFVIQLAEAVVFKKDTDNTGIVSAFFDSEVIGDIIAMIPELAEQMFMGFEGHECCDEGCTHEHH